MKKGSSKAKGSANERNLCKVLSEWWTKKTNPIVFWRVGSSGAQFTLSGGTTEMAGDIVAIHPDGIEFTERFSVETKFVKNFDLLDLLFPEKKTNFIENSWKQCTRDAEKVGRHPFMIFKKNKLEYLFMIEENVFDLFKLNKKPFIIHNERVLGRFNDFMKLVGQKEVLKCLKRKNSK